MNLKFGGLMTVLVSSLLILASVNAISLPTAVAASNPPLGPSSVLPAAHAATQNLSALDWTDSTGPGVTGTQGWDYSPQTQINESSIGNLQVAYMFPIPSIWSTKPDWGPCSYINGTAPCRYPGLPYSLSLEGTQAPVLSSQGVGYVTTNGLTVYAFSLADGHLVYSAADKMDWASYAKQPWAVAGAPGHLHGDNMVDGVIWVPGFGCQVQGFDAGSGALAANLTGMCNNVPGNYSPHTGWGSYYSYGDNAIQVDVPNNVILFNLGASAEGTGQGRMMVVGCSLSAALNKANLQNGQGCVAKGGACTTPAGGACSNGSTMLWRTFLMPPIDGSNPDFTLNLCKTAHVWIGGVPCSSLPQSLLQNDWQTPSKKGAWNGTDICPSCGMSQTWGNYALDDADGLFFVGTSQTGPAWNGTYRPGPNLLGDSIVGISLKNGSIVWADKTIARDNNDYDCNLNVIIAQVANTKEILKTCKSGVVTGINALTGQPLWVLDTTMPDYKTLGSSAVSPLSQPFECVPGNNTSCNVGAMWDRIYHLYDAGKLKMSGSNPHPHGYIAAGPYRGSVALDPLNNTEMTQFICPIGTNPECQKLAGVGTLFGCPEVTTVNAPCPAFGQVGKQGFVEGRYFAESEDAFDGKYFYITVMDGPMEHDYISNVDYKGNFGITFDTNLYFAGTMPTNTTVMAIDPASGKVVWNYTRPIYYRGGLIATGGMLITQWPDGHLIFLDAATGRVVRDMSFGTPLLAPMSIAPDFNGKMHLLVDFGGTIHPVLGEVGLHGALGHGYIVPGTIVSLALGPGGNGTSTVVTYTAGGVAGGSTVDVYSYAFYALVATVVVLAVVAGGLVITRRRGGAGVANPPD